MKETENIERIHKKILECYAALNDGWDIINSKMLEMEKYEQELNRLKKEHEVYLHGAATNREGAGTALREN